MSRMRREVHVPIYVLAVGIALVVVSPILAVIASTRIASRALAESETKWCAVVGTLDDSYRESPPQTPAGKNVAQSIADLRRGLECPVR